MLRRQASRIPADSAISIMTRYRAFFIHLLASILVIGTFMAITLTLWYPPPYFELNGAQRVLTILASVDMTLGPLMTLLIYKPGKPGLRFDLAVIVAIQLTAFLYGAFITINERPAYIVYAVDRFEVVPAAEVDTGRLQYPELDFGPLNGPSLVTARIPDDPMRSSNILLDVMLEGGVDIERRAELFEPYIGTTSGVLERSKPIAKILHARQVDVETLQQVAAENKIDLGSLRYVPIVGKYKSMTALIHPATGDLIGVLDIDPWVTF